MKLFHLAILALVSALTLPAFAQTKPTATDMQIFAHKVKADRKLLVATNMQLTEVEAKGFWPVYDAYPRADKALLTPFGKLVFRAPVAASQTLDFGGG